MSHLLGVEADFLGADDDVRMWCDDGIAEATDGDIETEVKTGAAETEASDERRAAGGDVMKGLSC